MRFFLTICTIFFFATSAFAAPPAKEFGKLPKIYDAAISPDGSMIAAFANVNEGYGIGVYYIDGSGRKSFAIGMPEGVKPEWIKWANNDIVLASIWQNERIRSVPIRTGFLYSLDVQKKDGEILIKPDNGDVKGSRIGSGSFFRQFNNTVIDYLNDDPDHILMSFTDETGAGALPIVQKVNVRSGKYKRVQTTLPQVTEWTTDLQGRVRIGEGRSTMGDGKYSMHIYDVNSKDWSTSKKYPGLDADDNIYGFTANPNELVIGRYNGKDTRGLYVYDLQSKSLGRKLFHHDYYDARNLVLTPDGKDILGVRYLSDVSEIELIGNKSDGIKWVREKYAGYNVAYIDSTQDFSKVLVKVSDASEPGTLFLADNRTKTTAAVSKYYEGLPSREMGSVISVNYTARDGQKIPAYVTLPPSITDTAQLKDLPFIVLPHGGPYARSSGNFYYFAQFFATRGYGVLQMNFRGSAGYGKTFMEAGRENWVVMQEDVEDGTRWLVEKGYADPERTCIAGWSYGGYAALMGSIKNPELYACTISIAGVTDLSDLIHDQKRYIGGRLTAKNSILSGFDGSKELKENSPVKRAKELQKPVFLAHGTGDVAVHFDQFKRMKSALKKSSVKVTALEFKDEDHYMSDQENRIEMLEALEKFLEQSVGKSEHMK